MLTSQGIWQNQSPSNEFKVTYIEFRNQLIITTSKFTEDYINDQNSFRLELIYKLYERGMTNDLLDDYCLKQIFFCSDKKFTFYFISDSSE